MKPCTKHPHASRGAAAAHLRNLLRIRPSYVGEAYWCPFCDKWHVGRPNARVLKVKK